MKKALFILLLALTGGGAAQAQRAGQVLDAKNREPVVAASVYINGSSVGTTTDENGRFSLAGFPAPPFQLTISAIGYETAVLEMVPGEETALSILLAPRAIELQEVVVRAADKNGWEKYGREFMADFIGYSEFAGQCKILNPKVLSFVFNEQAGTLRVYSDKPLQIQNQALGYTITYWLEDFQKDYAANSIFFQGSSQFKDMIGPKTKKKRAEGWMKNRASAYAGSLQHFVRSLYAGRLEEEGFELRRLRRISTEDYLKTLPKTVDTLFFHNDSLQALYQHIIQGARESGNEATLTRATAFADQMLEKIREWYRDSSDLSARRFGYIRTTAQGMVQEMYEFRKDELQAEKIVMGRFTLSQEEMQKLRGGRMELLYTPKLSADSLLRQLEDGSRVLSFADYLHLTYLRETEEENYRARQSLFGGSKEQPQVSVLSLQGVEHLRLYPNGHFEPAYGLLLERYWSYEKIDKLLPLEFGEKGN